MQFTRLRLSGFKSFVEPAELRIEPGLTGIVGPNGCGKSNLVEALGWVMGEGSAKQMRASGMDNVIFAGTSGRPARNMAEVGLVIENSGRTAPAHFNDEEQLEITRRIEREAGSIYRINGRDARARDVSLFFADAASGPRSTAIVRQGRIGALLNAKPKERRAILEEAAGIGGLHSRRHEAELRLRAAETNLTRLDDIMAQLETQIAALKRQARQASRYRNLSEHIRHGEALLFHLRWQETVFAVSQATELLEQAEVRVADATRDAATASTAQLEAAEAVPPLRQTEAAAAAALHRLSVARDSLEAEGARIAQQTARSESSLSQLQLDQTREAAHISDSDHALQQLEQERQELEAAHAKQHGQGDALREQVAQAAAILKTSEAALDAATRRLADLTAQRESLTREATQTRQRFDRLTQQLGAVTQERAQLQSEMPAAPQMAEIEQFTLEARQAVTAAREAVSAAEAHREETQKTEAAAREVFQSARTVTDRLAAEEKALTDLLNDRGGDLWPPLVDALRVTPGYETALGAALGDDLEYPSDDSAPVHWAMLAGDGPLPALPEGAEPLDRYVTGAPALARRLSQIGVVDGADGIFLRGQLKPGQRLVSREGALWRWDGLTAAADAPAAAAKRLEMRNRLADVTLRRQDAEAQMQTVRESFEQATNAAATARSGEADCRRYVRQKEEALSQALDAQAKAERATLNRTARLAALVEAQSRIESECAEADSHLKQTEQAQEGLEPDEQPRAVVAGLRNEVELARSALRQAHGAQDAFARETSARAQRLEVIKRDHAGWAARKQGAAQQLEVLAGRAAELNAELENLRAQPGEIALRMEALLSEIAAASLRRDEAASALAAAEALLSARDKAARASQEHLGEMREARARADAAASATLERAQDLAGQIRERLECAPEECLRLANLEEDAVLPDVDTVERNLARFKRERENMGAVNLRAEEESRELNDRLEGMTRERADLEAAIARLRQAIGSLNREGRERLLAAFTTVNEHFSRLFVHLFGGGSARLELVESDDPLEAGLEILASPPGKRLQSMGLMSGGEQALTAMALIFAVFLTNPSPLCVLDEVDAPLDDANVERFCNLLDEMTRSTETRFLVITHNGVTMSRMDRLFGVTMAERGVSQLVSVDLERAEKLRAVG